jgi:hypothetical protein
MRRNIMPTTHHASAAERNMQAEHAHDAAAASRNHGTNLSGNEEMKISAERNREKQEHLEELAKHGKDERKPS